MNYPLNSKGKVLKNTLKASVICLPEFVMQEVSDID